MQPTLPSRRSRPVSRLIAGVALVLAVPVLSACGGIGFDDQTEQPYQAAVGVNDRSSEVDVLSAVVVSAKPGSGVLITSLVNNDEGRTDKLTDIQGEGVQDAPGATPVVPAGGLVNFADKAVGGIPLQGAKVKAGGYVTFQLSFENADPVTIEVPVVTDTGAYAGLAGPESAPAG